MMTFLGRPHLDSNGVECKLVPPTSPTPLNADSNDVENSAMIRNLNDHHGGVFAVPAVPKKSVSPRRNQPSGLAKPRKSYPKKAKTIRGPAVIVTTSPIQISQEPTDLPPPLKVRRSSDEAAVSNMVYSIAGLLRRRNVEKLANLAQRCGRITSFHVHHSVENGLNGGTSMFHDFLNRESFRPETKISVVPSGQATAESDSSPNSRNRPNKEDALLISSKASEDKSMQDLFGVLSVSKEDIKNKTSSQLMEFVKRVESNQRREAFEKQQRPAYLLKLARTQSADRSTSYLAHAQNLHRAVDRANVLDPGRTDSSSGGESADEAENDAFQQTAEPDHFISIEHRALHRYAKARHAISTRYQYAHRQFARMEYGCQVMGSLLQRLQQKQGIAVFGDGALEDCKTSIRPAFPLHRDASCPRAWDDRDVVTAAKTANSTSFLRVATPASNCATSLHPSASSLLFKKKTKVAAPNFGLNYQLDTYEATMWKERLCSGKLIVEAGGSESEDLEELPEEGKEKELTECAVTSARGCARARPLSAFRKRMLVSMDSFPPRRLSQEDKPRFCDCYSRSLMPDVLGPVSCAVCMGQLAMPNWTSRTALMKTSPQDALSHLDRTYNPHLSQPSNRSLDILLSGVSLDFDPSKLMNLTSPVKPRLTRRQKYLAAVKLEADLLRAIRKQEEEIRLEKQRILKMESGKYLEDGAQPKRSAVRKDSGKNSRARTRRVQNRQVAVRKRRHSSVSSETTVSSDATSRTRSVSVGSVDNSKPVSKRDRGLSRTASVGQSSNNRKRREATGVDPTNYVIPYGMTAPSKIEKIQYKEIVVPKFRDRQAESAGVNGMSLEPPDVPVMVKVEPMDDSDSESVEDLSDSVFIARHVPCELEERSRFNVPEKNTRRRTTTTAPTKSAPVVVGELSTTVTTDCVAEEPTVEKVPGSLRKKSGRPAQSKSARRDSRVKGKRVGNKSTAVAVLAPATAAKRPRKTAAEISAMFPLNTRPVRARRSTFRASPDATEP